MLEFYFWPTPNTWKVAIMLEECGLPYEVIPEKSFGHTAKAVAELSKKAAEKS